MFIGFYQKKIFVYIKKMPVNADLAIALSTQVIKQSAKLALSVAYNRCKYCKPKLFTFSVFQRFIRKLEDLFHDLLRGLTTDFAAAVGAVWMSDACKQESQVVVNFRH